MKFFLIPLSFLSLSNYLKIVQVSLFIEEGSNKLHEVEGNFFFEENRT